MLSTLLLALQGCPLPLDLNTTPVPLTGNPEAAVEFNGRAYFVATTLSAGRELWSSDGTAGGTSVLFEPVPGSDSSNVFLRGQNNGLLYFTARTASAGQELWKTDGTAAGTELLLDIAPGAADASPTNLFPSGALSYFAANDGTHGTELWVTDGTAAGTHMVADHAPGAATGSLTIKATGGGVAFGSAPTINGVGNEPHYATATSVTSLGDLNPGASSTQVGFAAHVPGTTKFVFEVTSGATKVYATAGTAASTRVLANVDVDSAFVETGLAAPGAELFFIVKGSTGGQALWHTDGTKNGTAKFMDFAEFQNEEVSLDGSATFGGAFYFTAKSANHGSELWTTDGTLAGTSELIDWVPGPGGIALLASVEHAGELFLFVRDLTSGEVDLIATAGTAATTRLVTSLSPSEIGTVAQAAGGLFFGRSNFEGKQLWFSDGTLANTQVVDANALDIDDAITPVVGGALYRHAASVGPELWISDGGSATLVKDLEPITPTEGTNPRYLTDVFGRELWMVIGNVPARLVPGGTLEVLPVLPAPFVSEDPRFTGFWNGAATRVAFVAPASLSTSHVLWVTDGTVAGTLETGVVVDVQNVELAALGAGLVFAGEGSAAGRELWFTDGTLAGTSLLADIAPALGAESQPTDFVVVGERLYFVADDGVNGRELWSTDGTSVGTAMIADLNPAGTSYPVGLTRVGQRLAFFASATGGWGNHDLWVTDGTAPGTELVATLNIQAFDLYEQLNVSGSARRTLPVVDGALYFPAAVDGAGYELWRSDLTAMGTALVADLNPAGDTTFESLVAADGRVWFGADAGATSGLFVSDGSPGGTQLVPGSSGLFGIELVGAGQGVYLSSYGGQGALHFTDGGALQSFCTGTVAGEFANNDVDGLALVGGDLYMRAEVVLSGKEFAVLPDPGAHVVDLGLGRSSLVLQADPPQLGTLASVQALGSPPTKVSVLAMSNARDEPWAFAPYGDQAIWLSPVSLSTLAVFSPSSWTYSVALPLDPALIGFAVNVQAVSVDAQDGSAPEMSNGLRLVLGN